MQKKKLIIALVAAAMLLPHGEADARSWRWFGWFRKPKQDASLTKVGQGIKHSEIDNSAAGWRDEDEDEDRPRRQALKPPQARNIPAPLNAADLSEETRNNTVELARVRDYQEILSKWQTLQKAGKSEDEVRQELNKLHTSRKHFYDGQAAALETLAAHEQEGSETHRNLLAFARQWRNLGNDVHNSNNTAADSSDSHSTSSIGTELEGKYFDLKKSAGQRDLPPVLNDENGEPTIINQEKSNSDTTAEETGKIFLEPARVGGKKYNLHFKGAVRAVTKTAAGKAKPTKNLNTIQRGKLFTSSIEAARAVKVISEADGASSTVAKLKKKQKTDATKLLNAMTTLTPPSGGPHAHPAHHQ